MNKAHRPINWENYPSDETPLNESNLNKMDSAIGVIDDRVITLDTTKATKAEVATLVADVTFEESTGIITITKKNGSKVAIDTQMEKIAINFDYSPTTQKITLTLIDGTKQYIDLSALITQYEFLDTDTVAFSVNKDGKVSAIVKEGSIKEKHLDPNYLANIKVEVAKAQASQTAAAASESNASKSATAAASSASSAKTSETNAASSAAAAATSAKNAKTSETNAKSSETSASQSATTATNKATSASQSAATATDKAAVATQKATEIVGKAEAAAKSANEAKSYAVGGTGTRAGEDTNNAKYYCEKAKESVGGAVVGVKGAAESSYRNGNVNLTAEDIGAVNADKEKLTPADNLIPYPYFRPNTFVTNGITFTVNDDGSITANGTATATAYFALYSGKVLDLEIGKKYTLSLEVENGTAHVYLANYTTQNTDIAWVRNVTNSKKSMTFTYSRVEGCKGDSLGVYISSGITLTNCKIKVQLEEGMISHAYQPTPISNISLYENAVTGATNNLIAYPYVSTTKTENGITWTDNGDGTVTANGTAAADAIFLLSIFSVPAGTYTVSGSPKVIGCSIQLSASNDWSMTSQAGASKTITYAAENKFTYCRCLILKDTKVSNAVFKPQLERGKIVHDYAPYKNNVAICSTGRATAAKVATLANFILTVGTTIAVKFTDTAGTANPASGNLTLNVNGTGAKAIGYFRNGNKTAITYVAGNYFYNNATHIFTYDGTYWLCMDWNADNNNTYSNMTAATASAAGKAGLVPAPAAGKQGQYLRGDATWATPTTVVNNNTTTTAGIALDARQANPNVAGSLAAQIAGKANASHTHSYLPLSGGTLTGSLVFAKGTTTRYLGPLTDVSGNIVGLAHNGQFLSNAVATNGSLFVGNESYGANYILHVKGGSYFNGDIDVAGKIYNAKFAGTPTLQTLDGTSGRYAIGSWGTDGKRVSDLGVNVDGSLQVNCQTGNAGSGYATHTLLTNVSDARLKENVEESEVDALSLLRQIKIRKFRWNGIKQNKFQEIGFIADELEELDENFTSGGGYNEDGSMNLKTVDTLYLLGYVVKALQQMNGENCELKKELVELKKTLKQ